MEMNELIPSRIKVRSKDCIFNDRRRKERKDAGKVSEETVEFAPSISRKDLGEFLEKVFDTF